MKKVFVLGLQPDPDGPVFGRVMDPNDFQKSQDYAHDHTTQVVKTLLVAGTPSAQVAGFDATIAGGLNLNIGVGSALDAAGVSYETGSDPTAVALNPADPALPRIDLVYASLAIDTPALSEFRPFRRLRTQAELEAGTPEFPPAQFNQPTELHTRATIAVKTGVANAVPVEPVAGANEVPLWRVHVAAGQVNLVNGDLTDARASMKSLYQVLQDVLALQGQIGTIAETVQDIVAAFISSPDASLTLSYNDGANTLTIVLAAGYKALLDGATTAATGNTLVKRDSSGDSTARDFRPTRQIGFPDSSIMATPRYAEQQIFIFDLETFFTTNVGPYPNTVATVVRPSGIPYYINLKAEDFVNIPLVLEVVMEHPYPDGVLGVTAEVQLFNVTNNTILTQCRTQHGMGVSQVRSQIFFLTGSGRKRLQIRAGAEINNRDTRVFSARLIAYPAYQQCGGWSDPACPI